MKSKLFFIFFLAVSGSVSASLAQVVTNNPEVEEASVNYVHITRVEITKAHTAIYLRFEDKQGTPEAAPRNIPPQLRRFYMPESNRPEIWIDPNTRLYKPGDINTKFKFLRAEGIPTNPERKSVESGEVVEFVAYFEPVTPGIEIIDFYEGKSSGNTVAWNFYGIHIKNPVPGKTPKKTAPEKKEDEAVSAEPVPEQNPGADAGLTGLTGAVLNSETGQPVAATISFVDEGDTVGITTRSGKFRIALEPGKIYTFKASAKGFGDEIWQLDPAEAPAGQRTFEHDFRLSPLTEGKTFTLENIYFETSSYKLLPESFGELDGFVRILAENPNLQIRVEGHTDSVGDFDKNVELSRQRAESVKQYLVGKGIAGERIETKGFGPTRPVAKGGSDEQRQKNRRVEIVILKS